MKAINRIELPNTASRRWTDRTSFPEVGCLASLRSLLHTLAHTPPAVREDVQSKRVGKLGMGQIRCATLRSTVQQGWDGCQQ